MSLSAKDYVGLISRAAGSAPSKFRSKKTIVGSRTFDSKAEAARYSELFIMQHRGEISDLECQPEYEILLNGHKICKYIPDFRYLDKTGRRHIEDVKSKATITSTYRLKKKLFEAMYSGLVVEEVTIVGGRSVVSVRPEFNKPTKAPKAKRSKDERASVKV